MSDFSTPTPFPGRQRLASRARTYSQRHSQAHDFDLGCKLRRGSQDLDVFQPAPPKTIVDDRVWVDGDFELVSVDNVRFRVPSFYLFAASAVFREASELEPGAEEGPGTVTDTKSRPESRASLQGIVWPRYIHFADPDETAAVLTLFLDFIVHCSFAVPDDGTTLSSLEDVCSLVHFMKRYQCPALDLLLVTIREVVRQPSKVSPLACFIAGATAGDALTCSVALDVDDWIWRMMDMRGHGADDAANVFDPHYMPVRIWQLIPPMYTWALTTAWRDGEGVSDMDDVF